MVSQPLKFPSLNFATFLFPTHPHVGDEVGKIIPELLDHLLVLRGRLLPKCPTQQSILSSLEWAQRRARPEHPKNRKLDEKIPE